LDAHETTSKTSKPLILLTFWGMASKLAVQHNEKRTLKGVLFSLVAAFGEWGLNFTAFGTKA